MTSQINRFVITGLPRMRSAWFSAYLTTGDVFCYYEAIKDSLPLNGYKHTGTADCGYLLRPEWVESIGEHKLVVIHRNLNDVLESAEELGLTANIELLPYLNDKLYELDGLHVDFDDINDRLLEIHNYIGLPCFNKDRANMFINMKIQTKQWSR